MTALVLLVAAWTLAALSMVFVVGHGITLADACIPAGSCADEATTRRARPTALAA